MQVFERHIPSRHMLDAQHGCPRRPQSAHTTGSTRVLQSAPTAHDPLQQGWPTRPQTALH